MALAHDATSRRERAMSLRDRPALGWLLALLPFLALTLLWLALDSRVPDFDSGRSLQYALNMRDALARGDLLAPITLDNFNHYPPLVYLVGSLGLAIGGDAIDAMRVAYVLVFMPLLALGVWGTARRAYGPGAGALAVVFALGAPAVVSFFHAFMLDVAEAAMVAMCVWLLLESRRFERAGLSALAGAFGGLAMLTKPTAVIFLAGPFAVVLLRGGWRHRRGLLAFLVVGAVLSAPWYIDHLHSLVGLTSGAASDTTGGGASQYLVPPRWSSKNLFWYGWNLLNVQLLAPLFASFAIGLVVAIARFWRERSPDDPTPELLLGGLVSYLGMTWILLKDPRYTTPAMVYIAAFGVAWVPAVHGARRLLAAGAVVVIAAVNALAVSFALGHLVKLSFTHQPPTPLGERTIRILSPAGLPVSDPHDDSAVLRAMRAAKADGVKEMELDPGGDVNFNPSGLQVLLRIAGLRQPPAYAPQRLGPDTAFLTRHALGPGAPPPCGRISGGYGVYMIRGGNAVVPFQDYKLYCPRR